MLSENLNLTPADGVTIRHAIKIPALKIAVISGQIERGKIGILAISELPFQSAYYSCAPINSYEGSAGEIYVERWSTTLAVAISSNTGDGKFQIIIPYL